MNVRFVWLVCVATSALTFGCRARSDPSVDLLEGELRWMEDQLLLLDDELQTACGQLASCQRENLSLRQELSRLSRGERSSPRTVPPAVGGSAAPTPAGPPDRAGVPSPPQVPPSDTAPPAPTPPQPAEPVLPGDDQLQPPPVELGVPVEPTAGTGPPLDRTGRRQPDILPNLAPSPEDDAVVAIVLNSWLTGGYDFDGRPGHEGVLAVVEPRSKAGEYVPVPGELTLVVIDPAATGPAARVARWDFSAAETATCLRTSWLGKGIHLQLPWPHGPPAHERLELFARYTTRHGRKLEVHRTIEVDVRPDRPAIPKMAVIPTAAATALPTPGWVGRPSSAWRPFR